MDVEGRGGRLALEGGGGSEGEGERRAAEGEGEEAIVVQGWKIDELEIRDGCDLQGKW